MAGVMTAEPLAPVIVANVYRICSAVGMVIYADKPVADVGTASAVYA